MGCTVIYKGKEIPKEEFIKNLIDEANATKIESPTSVDVREQAGNGETVGKGNAEPKEIAQKSEEEVNQLKNQSNEIKNDNGVSDEEIRGQQSGQENGQGRSEKNDGEGEQTGIKKVITESTRAERNLPPVKLSKIGSDSEVLARGKESVDTGKIKPNEVADRVIKDNGVYTPDEAAAMQYYGHQLANHEKSLREAYAETKDPAVLSNLQQLSDQIDQFTQANRINSRSWGNLGNIMQIEADKDFSPANIRSIIKENYGGEIPKHISEKLDKLTLERDEAIKNLKEVTEKSIQQRGAQVVEKMRRSVISKSKEQLKSEASDLLTDLRKAMKSDFSKLNAGIPIPTETLAVMGKLAVNYFQQGVKDFEGIAAKIYDDLKDLGVDKNQVREYLSNYEPLREESKGRRLKLLGTKERSLEKQVTTGEIRDYRRKPEITFKTDNEVAKAKQRVADLEHKIKGIKSESFKASQKGYQRALNWITRWERRAVLASPLVLEKLTSAATIGAAINRFPKQIIGGAFSAAFKGIAEKAPIEGGLNINAEIGFWKEFLDPKKFAHNAKEILKTGASDLTKKYSEKNIEHYPGWDAMMDLHAIIKDPPKRATFETSLKYAYDWAAKNGLDYTDPLIQKSLENAAFKRAEYEIFQENTGISKRINDFINTDRVDNNFEATKRFLVKFLLPIQTVPFNIARRIGSSIVGLPHGLYEATKAYRNGIENLTEDQAETIMRQLKNGSVGLAYYSIGLFAAKSILGGVWQKDDKEGKKSLPTRAGFNEMRIGNFSIDKRIQHAMPLYIMQLGATTARVYNHYMDVPTDDPKYQSMLKSTIKAMMATAGAEAEEIPTINEPVHAVEGLSDPYEREKFGEDVKRRLGFSILKDLGVTEKESNTPLDKKIVKSKDDEGNAIKLSKQETEYRKSIYDKLIAGDKSFDENKYDWTSDFNDDWEDSKKSGELKKQAAYWKQIGRSDKYIKHKLADIKQDALNAYIEKKALELSDQYIKDNPMPKKNKFSIK